MKLLNKNIRIFKTQAVRNAGHINTVDGLEKKGLFIVPNEGDDPMPDRYSTGYSEVIFDTSDNTYWVFEYEVDNEDGRLFYHGVEGENIECRRVTPVPRTVIFYEETD